MIPPSAAPIKKIDTDFLVAGGGLAGLCAAISAARNGARVVLLQDRSVLGGNASSEIKMHAAGADCHGSKPGARESGLIEEFTLEDAARNPHRSYSQWDLLLYEKAIQEPNLTLLLNTNCIGATTTELPDSRRRIAAVRAVCESTEDTYEIRARYFADCTGDGRLGAECGAEFTRGREAKSAFGETLAQDSADQQTLGSSILFTARLHPTPQPFVAPAWARRFTAEELKLRWIPKTTYEYGYWWLEWGGQLDTIKDNAAIRHELWRIALGVWDYVKNSGEHPGSANWALEWIGTVPGKRESRRFVGPHVLTEHDVLGARIFPDQVAYGGWAIDLHPPSGVDAAKEQPYTPTVFPHLYSIPLRSYYSRNVANLFVAGRALSATHVGFASPRIMKTCAVGGQAVGTAAALWLRASVDNDIAAASTPTNIHALQQALLRDDAFLLGLSNHDPADLARQAKITASSELATAPAHLIADGITRDLRASFGPWSTDSVHHWESVNLPASISLILPSPAKLREVHLTFDSGFERELTLSASDSTTAKMIRGPQPETVKHYRIRFDDYVVVEESGNHLRKRVHRVNAELTVRRVTVEILATHGLPVARVFEVRLYA
jgi:hypothetical protein